MFTATNFHQSTWLRNGVFLFLISSEYFFIFDWLFKRIFNFLVFVNFPNSLLLLTSNLIPLWSENVRCMNSSVLKALSLGSCPKACLSWGRFCVQWRRKSAGSCHVHAAECPGLFCCLAACVSNRSVHKRTERGAEVSTTPLDLPPSPQVSQFLSHVFGALLLGAYMFSVFMIFLYDFLTILSSRIILSQAHFVWL